MVNIEKYYFILYNTILIVKRGSYLIIILYLLFVLGICFLVGRHFFI